MKTLYTAKVTSERGRAGHAKSDDGIIDLPLSVPTDMGGDGGNGTNPEQFFGAAYSACFGGAVKAVADQHNVDIGEDFSVTAHISLGKTEEGNFQLAAELDTYLPKVTSIEVGEKIINEAHIMCPFSRATRDNIDVTLNLLLDE